MRHSQWLSLPMLMVASYCDAAAEVSDPIAVAVDTVLAVEAENDISDRDVRLKDFVSESKGSAKACWASGYVWRRNTWQSFAAVADAAVSDDWLLDYIDLRDQEQLTEERHRELADWCRVHRLLDQERAHLWTVVGSSPNDSGVWKRLGYVPVDGGWLPKAELQRRQELQAEMRRNLDRWNDWGRELAARLSDPRAGTRDAGRLSLSKVKDPSAIPALEQQLSTHSVDLAHEYLHWLASLPKGEQLQSLIVLGTISSWEEVRRHSAELLADFPRNDVIPLLIPLVAIFRNGTESTTGARSLPIVNLSDPQNFAKLLLSLQRLDSTIGSISLGEVEYQSKIVRQSAFVRFEAAPVGPLEFYGLRRDKNRMEFVLSRIEVERQRIISESEGFANASQRLSRKLEFAKNVSDNARMLLSSLTHQGLNWQSEDWWLWWAAESNREPTIHKQLVEVVESGSDLAVSAPRVRIDGSCLPAGTLAYTELGPRPIEMIRLGDKVLSKDIETGELAYRVVLQTTVRRPQPLVKLSTASETIESTRGHHFWVSGKGWRMAKEIQPGDRLHGVKGTVRITDVSTGDMAEVYNLVVDRANTYFVGKSLVLSHDVTFPIPTDVKVPGLAAK